MKKTILLLYTVLFATIVQAQTSQNLPSSTTVANASVANEKQYSAFSNPASAANLAHTEFGIQYDNRFNLKYLSQKSMYAIVATKWINVGLSSSYFGYNQYNELITALMFSRNFNSVLSLGVQYNYLSVYYAETNKRYAAFFPQIGLQIRPSSAFTIGFQTFNPMQQSIKTTYVEKHIPSVFSLGCGWKISENLQMLLQTDKNTSGNYRFAGGFEYEIKDFLTLKTGAYTAEHLVPTLGVGLKLQSFDFHLNAEMHPILGFTSIAALCYKIQKK